MARLGVEPDERRHHPGLTSIGPVVVSVFLSGNDYSDIRTARRAGLIEGETVIGARAAATFGPREPFRLIEIERRDLRPHDVLIAISHAGICHSDIHHAHNDFGKTAYPLVPGHEIVGTVSAVGSDVTKFAVGDRAGVGCMVDACRQCQNCRAGMEQFCREGDVKTSNGVDREGQPTQGGYSDRIVVDEAFVVRTPETIAPERAAPLLCAGITLYSPLRHWQAGPGKRVAIVGFGGIGHVGVQISRALGAHTTVLDLSLANRDDGLRLGADDYRTTSDPATFTELADSFDLIISTVPANLDMQAYLGLLALDGTLVVLGVPQQPMTVPYFPLLRNRRSIGGSLIGGMAETQEMIDFCAEHAVGAEVEVIPADRIDEAYDLVLAGKARYRFVIDIGSLDSLERSRGHSEADARATAHT